MTYEGEALFVGIDWSVGEQVAALVSDEGRVVGERSFLCTGDALATFCEELRKLVGDEPARAHVAIETPHGAIVDTLLDQGFSVFAINPKQLSRFRDRFSSSGAKDDRRDARVLADSLRTDPRAFRRLAPESPETIGLREWSRMAEALKGERVRLSNQLRAQLRRYFPQMLEITGSIWKNWFCDLWSAVPTPERAKRIRAATVQRILSANRIRSVEADEVLQTLRATPLTVAPGVVEAATAHIELLIERLRVVNAQIKRSEKALDDLCKLAGEAQDVDSDECGPHDVEILRSLPGVGRIVLAVLLAEGAKVLRERDYQQLRRLSGVAPVTVRSGKCWRVTMRRACHQRLRNALYHMALSALKYDPHAKACYARLRSRGHRHGRALRGVADGLLRAMCAMLRDRTCYDPSLRPVPSS